MAYCSQNVYSTWKIIFLVYYGCGVLSMDTANGVCKLLHRYHAMHPPIIQIKILILFNRAFTIESE